MLTSAIEMLIKRVSALEDKVEKLQSEQDAKTPVPPNWPFTQPYVPSNPWNPLAPVQNTPPPKCSKCGLSFNGTMGYVCPVIGCPTGLGGPTC